MATKKDLWNIKNPNLLNSDEILASNASDINTSLPKTKTGKEPLLKSINLPYKSIFDQIQVTKSLFDTPRQILRENPNLLTYQEYDYLVEGEESENKGTDILTVNNALKSGNFILGEEILGRKLTPVEIARQRVSDETVYTMPSSEPQYKTFENLNLVFDTTDPQEENKINELSSTLAKFNIPYSINEIDDDRVEIKSGRQNKSVLFPRVTTTKSYDEETSQERRKGTLLYTPEMKGSIGSSDNIQGRIFNYLRATFGWQASNYTSKINQFLNKKELLDISDKLGLGYRTDMKVTELKNDLIGQVFKEITGEMPEIKERKQEKELQKEQPFEIVEEGSVSTGSGLLRRKLVKKKIFI